MNKAFDAKVHFITGKGGVGKTLISQALVQVFSRLGHKTLLVSLSEESSFEPHHKSPIIKQKDNLYSIKIFPDQALFEYVSLKLPQKMAQLVLSKSLINDLAAAIPGLFDLTRLGKIWFHADEQQKISHEIFDKIVVDMPSTGFVVRFLSVASVVKKALKIGPIAKDAEQVDRYFKDPNNARLHLVTLLSDLVVFETLELYQQITPKDMVHLGNLIINRKTFETLPAVKDRAVYPQLAKVCDFFEDKYRQQKKEEPRLNIIPLEKIYFSDQLGNDDTLIIEGLMAQLMAEQAHA